MGGQGHKGSCHPYGALTAVARPSPSTRWAVGQRRRGVGKVLAITATSMQGLGPRQAATWLWGRMWRGCAHHLQPFGPLRPEQSRHAGASSSLHNGCRGCRAGLNLQVRPQRFAQHLAAQAGGATTAPAAWLAGVARHRGIVTGSSRSIHAGQCQSLQGQLHRHIFERRCTAMWRGLLPAPLPALSRTALYRRTAGGPESGRPWWSCPAVPPGGPAQRGLHILCLPQRKAAFARWRWRWKGGDGAQVRNLFVIILRRAMLACARISVS